MNLQVLIIRFDGHFNQWEKLPWKCISVGALLVNYSIQNLMDATCCKGTIYLQLRYIKQLVRNCVLLLFG